MPKYDAFGREIGEDTLEGLGESGARSAEWSTEDLAEARAEAAPAPTRPREPDTPPVDPPTSPRPVFVPPPRTARTTVRVRRGGLGCLGILIVGPILLAVLGVAAALLVGLSTDTNIEAPKFAIPGAPELPDSSTSEPAKPPRGLQRRSLLRRANFARALGRLRAARLGRMRSLRVAPERIDAQLLTKGGRLRSVQVTFDGELKNFGASGPGFGFVDTVPFARINSAAPERLTRQSARRLGRKTSSLDYLSYRAGTGEIAWGAYFKDGRYVVGDARGRFLRRVN